MTAKHATWSYTTPEARRRLAAVARLADSDPKTPRPALAAVQWLPDGRIAATDSYVIGAIDNPADLTARPKTIRKPVGVPAAFLLEAIRLTGRGKDASLSITLGGTKLDGIVTAFIAGSRRDITLTTTLTDVTLPDLADLFDKARDAAGDVTNGLPALNPAYVAKVAQLAHHRTESDCATTVVPGAGPLDPIRILDGGGTMLGLVMPMRRNDGNPLGLDLQPVKTGREVAA